MSPRSLAVAAALAGALALPACADPPASGTRVQAIDPRRAADMIHAALAADRAVYTREVVNRLTRVHKVQVVEPEKGGVVALEAREDWRSEHGKLPLPAQMFRMGAEAVLEGDSGLASILLSEWPVNQQNAPKSEVERTGLARVGRERTPYYGTEVLDGRDYFVAIYPDVATVEACVSCHNAHPDSPRKDFKVGDVMGGMLLRFPL